MINPKCDFCKKELNEAGGILLSPPAGNFVQKLHICQDCYLNRILATQNTKQNILITGASRGIGKAIADRLSFDGHQVIRHSKKELKISEDAIIDGADFNVPETARYVFSASAKYGNIDAIVLNAAICPDISMDANLTDWLDVWDKVMNINVKANAILCKEAIEHFKQNGRGRIVFIASRTAFRGDDAERFAYAASKSALIGMARTVPKNLDKSR